MAIFPGHTPEAQAKPNTSAVATETPILVQPREGSSYYRLGNLHYTYADRDGIVVDEPFGQFRIQILRSKFSPDYCHQLVRETVIGPLRVRAVTSQEENVYPRRAGLRANEIIKQLAQDDNCMNKDLRETHLQRIHAAGELPELCCACGWAGTESENANQNQGKCPECGSKELRDYESNLFKAGYR